MRNTGEGAKPPLQYSLNLSAHFRVWVTVWVRQLTHILTHTFFSISATKSIENRSFRCFFGAAGQIRTADLILTNGGRQFAKQKITKIGTIFEPYSLSIHPNNIYIEAIEPLFYFLLYVLLNTQVSYCAPFLRLQSRQSI